MNLATVFAVSAEKNAAKTAVFWGDAQYSYERIRAQADREAAPAQAPVEPEACSHEGLVDIGDALGRLPLAQRAVLVLRIQEGLSEQEIAATLGISAGTVKSRLHRARAAFREVWES